MGCSTVSRGVHSALFPDSQETGHMQESSYLQVSMRQYGRVRGYPPRRRDSSQERAQPGWGTEVTHLTPDGTVQDSLFVCLLGF